MLLKKSGIGNLSELDSFSCPAKKYDLDLPMKSMQEFTLFDTRLLQDDNFRDDMIASMWRIASICVPMQQTVRDIFKKFISRDIVVQFTAVKNTGKKQVLCKTKFYSCVQDVVVAKYANDEKMGTISTKDFEQAVGRTINNAKDWDVVSQHEVNGQPLLPTAGMSDCTVTDFGEPASRPVLIIQLGSSI